MKINRLIFVSATIVILGVQASVAGCFADYKAKQDDPLRLHYGVIALPDSACTNKNSANESISAKIGRDGWKILSVMGIFDESGLQKRKNNAGAYYLRY